MKAINLRENQEYEVKEYTENNKKVLYIERKNQECSYQILKESKELVDDIENGMRYRHFLIDNKLYESFWSNVYKPFVEEIPNFEQLTLF